MENLALLQAANEELEKLYEEIRITEQILKKRQEVLNAIPECPDHGECVPHALEWIEKAKKALLLIKPDTADSLGISTKNK